ncbi:bacterial regulatory helix-turn-helix, lysR family protein [Paraburkholderia xenovorans LB400]|uniref:Transcriptional regulator, LysR family n=1 Tax=Paraburkholderia xenovorans (strain LB400) TaxID=266265 RepID=Q13H78_PARXL|nr:LysR family transcriptional regulator [Paraburkholderia xenovorans]ABE36561.1 transcriptional regulator, LysR family [Paraburkholderia xenovorans LB400]AIP35054.1 bacterial regulatory helix-turn-helix, lysR family protein [Paraburkholderia xenovorans LB400]
MDLRRLELMMQVAAAGSLSKAATVLGIAQPALGRQIRKLEEECGLRLVYRHGRGVSLTPEGQALIERAGPLVKQLAAIPADLQLERQSPEGLVTVGLTPTVCHLLGLELLTGLKQKYPRLVVHVVSGYSGYVLEWLVGGRLDMAILHDARRSPTVAVDPLAAAELFFVSPGAETTFERPAQPTLASLGKVPLALPTHNHGLRRTIEYAAAKEKIKLDVRYEVDTLELLKQIVVAGLACTILARPAVLSELAAGTLNARLLHAPKLHTRLVLATAAQRPVTHSMEVLEHELRTLFARLIDEGDLYGIVHPKDA